MLLTTKGFMEADNLANNTGSIAKPVKEKYSCSSFKNNTAKIAGRVEKP